MTGYAGSGPREILPGLTHWSVGWHRYSLESYAIEQPSGCVLIDPSDYPPHCIGAIERHGVSHILITNHFHERASAMLRGRFGAEVWAPEGDVGELESVTPDHVYGADTELPAGLQAIALGTITPGEHAFLWPENRGVLIVGDALGTTSYWTHNEGQVGAHPRARPPHALLGLLELPFTSLAVAHGEPILDVAKEALRRYLNEALDG